MTGPLHAIDCDVHPTVPDMKALLPYLDDFWRETVEERGINSLETDHLSAQRAAHRAAAMARQERRAAATAASDARARRSRPLAGRHRHLQLPLRRAACCSARTWRRPSRARSTTGSSRNGSIAIRACAPRSWCRCRTSNTRSTRSSAAPRTGASCRSWCWRCRRRRSAAATCGRSTPPPSATACRSASMPARATAIPITSLGWPTYYIEDYASHSRRRSSRRWRA